MGPFRLAIIAGLIYVLYRLLTSKMRNNQQQSVRQQEDRTVDDVLVEDPVCHTYIPQAGAESFRKNGETHYFCSKECRKKYESNVTRHNGK